MTNMDAVKSIKSRLAGLKRRERFIDYRESGPYARKLENLLDEIDQIAESPRQGVELVAAFIQTDNAVLESADDSDGIVGDVYSIFACDSFIRHASQCEDKEWLYDILLKLHAKDDFGVRGSLIESVAKFLPEPYLRRLVDEFWSSGEKETGEISKYHWFLPIESVARQLKDPELFERACRTKWPKLPTAGYLDIAEVYFESGYPLVALQWLDKVPLEETFQIDERERLLLKICIELGDKNRGKEVAWHIFRRYRDGENLAMLLEVLGYENLERVIAGETEEILRTPELSDSDVDFLLDADRIDEAEQYVMERLEQLDGYFYHDLLSWAEIFEDHKRFLVTSLIYRALLNSILDQGRSAAYYYGVKYLRTLDDLATKITDWGGFPDNEEYELALRMDHKRKFSFWKRYDQ